MSQSTAAPEYGSPWWLVLIEGVAAGLIGVLLLTHPTATSVVLIQFLGLWWLIGGVLSIVGMFLDSRNWIWKLLAGILGIIAGIIVLQHPFLSTLVVPTTLVVLIGILGLFIGALYILRAFQGDGWGVGILGALSALLGLLLIFNPLSAVAALPTILGILAIIGGVAAVVMSYRMKVG